MGMFTFSTKRQREPDAVDLEDNAAREKKVCGLGSLLFICNYLGLSN